MTVASLSNGVDQGFQTHRSMIWISRAGLVHRLDEWRVASLVGQIGSIYLPLLSDPEHAIATPALQDYMACSTCAGPIWDAHYTWHLLQPVGDLHCTQGLPWSG